MPMSHLLYPVAAKPQSLESLRHVVQLARTLAAKLTLLRVVNPFSEGGPLPVGEEALRMNLQSYGVDRTRLHLATHSDPAISIAQFAEARNIDAIVLPQGPRSWLRSLLGRDAGFTQRLSGETRRPLWLMGAAPRDEDQSQVRRILCAVSGRDLSVLETAADLSSRLNAKLFVLHVVPEVHEGLLAYGFDQHVALSASNAMQLLADLQARAGSEGQPLVEIGNTSEGIYRAARRLRADLVVTGRHKTKKSGPFEWAGLKRNVVAPSGCELLVV